MNRGTLTVLLYHGVTGSSSEGIENYSGKHIRREAFAEQMLFVSRHCHVLSMQEVTEHYKKRKAFPDNAVAVTFDDGFQNNYSVAAPILADLSIPAIFYVSTGFISTDRMFWVDIVEDCINRCRKEHITIVLGGGNNKFSLSTDILKTAAVEAIKIYCKGCPDDEKEHIVESLIESSGVSPACSAAANYRKMTWEEVTELDADSFFTIGSHSVNHVILSLLSTSEMHREVSESIAVLEKRLGHPVEHFSYPEGQQNHFNNEVITCLRESGIVCCPSAIEGVNVFEEDLFTLKRIMVGTKNRPFPFSMS